MCAMRPMRLVLYTGKGGVGKTTTAAATAACAAERGVRTLVVSSDVAHSLGDVLDCELGPSPVSLAPNLDAMEIDARVEIARHYGMIRDYLVELFRYQGIDDVVAEELALFPGAEEMTALLAVEEVSRSRRYDFVVVDCAPTGATLRLISLPDMLTGALRVLPALARLLSTVVSPLAQAVISAPLPRSPVFRELEQLVGERAVALRGRLSAAGTSVRIVATPERMVIDEARRAFLELALFDLRCDAVIMNRLLPESAGREAFFQDRWAVQAERQRELARLFEPVRVVDAPLQRDEVIGLEALAAHGREIFADVAPEAVISKAPRVRFTRTRDGHRVHLPLPGASPDALEVVVVDGELIVRAGSRRRALPLPPRIARLPLESARLDDGVLVISFAAAGSARAQEPA
jgi:arsenite-transporting ATPase